MRLFFASFLVAFITSCTSPEPPLEAHSLKEALAQPQRVHYLHLRNDTSLTQLPDSLLLLSHLQSLTLSHVGVTALPEKINRLTELQHLVLGLMPIRRLPDSIVLLEHLEFLAISSTALEQLPAQIGKLKGLTSISLSNDSLHDLPPSIGELENLWGLDVYDCPLGNVPSAIHQLHRLDYLSFGNCALTAFSAFPDSMSYLTSVSLFRNHLQTLPDTLNWPVIRELSVGINDFDSIPPVVFTLTTLQKLDLSDNNIQHIPAEITKLKSLQELNLSGNPLPEAQLTWLRRAMPTVNIIFEKPVVNAPAAAE